MFGYLTQDLKIACIYSMLMIGGLYGLVQGKQEISVHRYSRSTDEQAESRSSSRSSDEWSTVVRSEWLKLTKCSRKLYNSFFI